MKKITIVILSCLLVVLVLPFWSMANNYNYNVSVVVKGNKITFPDQKPFIDMSVGRTYVPLRFVSEALGAKVDWINDHAEVIKADKKVEMKIGETYPTINGNKPDKPLDAPALYMNGRTIVPLRFVSETLGEKITFNSNTSTVYIGEVPNIEEQPVTQGEYKVLNGFKIPVDAKVGTGSDPRYNMILGIGNINIYDTDFNDKIEDVRQIISSKYGNDFGDKVASTCLMKKTAFYKIVKSLTAPNGDTVEIDSQSSDPTIGVYVYSK